MTTKMCFKCGEVKPLDAFHRHAMMKDGHLNKCAACTVKDVAEWREKNPGCRAREWERKLEKLGKDRSRHGHGKCPIKKRKNALNYFHKKRLAGMCAFDKELDDFAFEEAKDLCSRRGGWEIDHIVPLRHRDACGLHNAYNLQVVPAVWNKKKGNRSMDTFFPTTGY